jgi:hypothetical protein
VPQDELCFVERKGKSLQAGLAVCLHISIYVINLLCLFVSLSSLATHLLPPRSRLSHPLLLLLLEEGRECRRLMLYEG